MAKKTAYQDWQGNAIAEEGLPEEYILMADGTVLPGGIGHDTDITMWAFIKGDAGMDMAQAVTLFSDEERTKVVKGFIGANCVGEWKKYSRIWACRQGQDGGIDIGMRQ